MTLTLMTLQIFPRNIIKSKKGMPMTSANNALPPKFEIDIEEITVVVQKFYTQVRKHEILGPVFGAHVEDWPSHEAKIALFWRNVIRQERVFEGNPQQAHMGAPEIQSEHFAIWLGLFDATLVDLLEPQKAESWSVLAHRIGRALKMGIDTRDAVASAPPRLY